jgi:hypothetical protein
MQGTYGIANLVNFDEMVLLRSLPRVDLVEKTRQRWTMTQPENPLLAILLAGAMQKKTLKHISIEINHYL